MIKKDYQLIADVIKISTAEPGSEEEVLMREFAHNLCNFLKEDNERFNRTKFLKACGFNIE